jgi:hypothetical protein
LRRTDSAASSGNVLRAGFIAARMSSLNVASSSPSSGRSSDRRPGHATFSYSS